ncbi:hypothetical protein ACLI09_04825 [Flavobacterium sp. RHBU_24]|uniref:hypothetical protein n=1 Tax=Flavobacterium sp. RHBU_24 TaxID=3391185 RepID=UPI003984F327
MPLNVDLLKPILETIDWIKKNYVEMKSDAEKYKLNTIIEDISTLIIHKNEYLYRLNEVKNSEEELKEEIKKSLKIAEADITKLLISIRDTELKASTVGLELNIKLNTAANIKMSEIERFNNLLNGSIDTDINTIIETLSSYKDKWIEIGKEIETLKKK